MGPGEQTDLLFLLGCLNGLMGIAACRLGYLQASEELHRAGWAYASAIDHRPLMARHQACTGGSPDRRCDAARQAVRNAHEARDRQHGYADDLLQIGGEYTISRATHHGLAGSALTTVTGAEGEAATELERAIEYYGEGPSEGEEHWFAGEPLAGIGLALVRLRSGALDAAVEALGPAFSLPPTQRITDLTTRLAMVRDELAAPIFRSSPQARALGEQIEEFGRDTVVAGLHSLPGGPG